MNERIEATDLVLAPMPVDQFNILVSDYIELLGGEPSVIRDLVLTGIVEAGLRVMREKHSEEANRRYAVKMGWPAAEAEEIGT